METAIDKIRNNIWKLEFLSPTPHAPYWRYICPSCLVLWEMEEKCKSYVQPCSLCILKRLGAEDNVT